ncbi:MAG: transcriptional regulator [Actinomycetota bacterium]
MSSSDPALLALHGLRLKGLASADTLSTLVGRDKAQLDAILEALAADGHAVYRNGQRSGWILTPPGREHHEALLAAELDAAPGRRASVETVYRTFGPLNTRFLALCTRWQVRIAADGTESVNRHDDSAYDQAVLDELQLIDREIRPLLHGLTGILDRFDIHRRRLIHALEGVNEGDTEWLTGPLVDSYHTVWFELHEDLLASLGLDRAEETARLRRNVTSASVPGG